MQSTRRPLSASTRRSASARYLGHVLDAEENRQSDARHGLDCYDAVLHGADVLREHDVDAGGGEHGGLFRQLGPVLRGLVLRRRDAAGDVGVRVDRVARGHGYLPGEPRVLLRPVSHAVHAHPGAVGPEAVRDDDVGARLQVVLVDLTDDVRGFAQRSRGPRVDVARGVPAARDGYPAALDLRPGATVHQQPVAVAEPSRDVLSLHGVLPVRAYPICARRTHRRRTTGWYQTMRPVQTPPVGRSW